VRSWFAFVVAAASLGCGSPDTTASPDTVFTVSSPLGNLDYPCSAGGVVLDEVTTPGAVDMRVACYFDTAESPAGANTRFPWLSVRNYHGSDVYVFQCDGAYADTTCSQDGRVGAGFPLGSYDLVVWPVGPGSPAASCTVTVDGPSMPVPGDRVSGNFACYPILARPNGTSTASSPPEELVSSIVGQFGVTVY
jgi:hypothetical protein